MRSGNFSSMRRTLLLTALVCGVGVVSYKMGKAFEFGPSPARAGAAVAVSSAPAVVVSSPAAPVCPEPSPNQAAWNEMTASLANSAKRFPGEMGIYIKDFRTGQVWEYKADQRFPSASLIKVPIMSAVFERIRNGEIRIDDELILKKGEKRGGSGRLRHVRYGTRLTIRQLLEKMITESDNTATAMVLDHLGVAYAQKHFREKIGFRETNISLEGMSLDSDYVPIENYTTPREMSMLFEKIYRGEMIDRVSSDSMMEILKRTKNRSRFKKGLPPTWELAHKTGMLRRSCHDVGVFFTPQGEYVMAVMTSMKAADYHYAANYISRVAKITYRYYGSLNNSIALSRARERMKQL